MGHQNLWLMKIYGSSKNRILFIVPVYTICLSNMGQKNLSNPTAVSRCMTKISIVHWLFI